VVWCGIPINMMMMMMMFLKFEFQNDRPKHLGAVDSRKFPSFTEKAHRFIRLYNSLLLRHKQ